MTASSPAAVIGFQLKHIGDVLMTLPALGLIKKQTPERRTALVVSPKMAPLIKNHPWVDEAFTLDRTQGRAAMKALARQLKDRHFGPAFIFDGQTRSLMTAVMAGLKPRIGSSDIYSLGLYSWFYHDDIHLERPDDRLASQNQRYQLMVAKALKLEPEPGLAPVPPPLPGEAIAKAEALLAELPGQGPKIGLTLQGLQYEKSWPLVHFVKLADELHKSLGASLFVTGGPGESPLAQSLAHASKAPVSDFCGRTDLLELIALAQASDLFITIDTGTAHVAALTNTPLISIFIWTSPALWPPQSPQARLLCYEWALKRFGLAKDDGPWLTAPEITPMMVAEEARHILSGLDQTSFAASVKALA